MSSPKEVRPCDRLKTVRKRLGKSQAEMAGILHISTKGYQRYESGEREIPVATIDRAREHIGLNPRWLYDGGGDMLLPGPGLERERIWRTVMGALPSEAVPAESPGAREFMARFETAGAMIDRLITEHDLPKTPTLREALRGLAVVEGVRLDHLAFLASAIKEIAKKQK